MNSRTRSFTVSPDVAHAGLRAVMPLPKGTLDVLAQLRALEQAVAEVQADLQDLQAERATLRAQVASVQMALAGFRRIRRGRGETEIAPARGLMEICAQIGAQADLPVDAIRGSHRSTALARARYAFCEAAIREGWAQDEIGYFMGGRPASMVANILCRGRKAAA